MPAKASMSKKNSLGYIGLQNKTIHLQSLTTQKDNIEWNKYNRYNSFEFQFTNKVPNYMDVKALKCAKI